MTEGQDIWLKGWEKQNRMRRWWNILKGAIIGFLVVSVFLSYLDTKELREQVNSCEKANQIITKDYLELDKNLSVCLEGFGGCYVDLVKCVQEKNNLTDNEMRMLLNITRNLA